jgi:hypothetical protein
MKNVDGTVFVVVVVVVVVFTMISFGVVSLKRRRTSLGPQNRRSHLIWGRQPVPLSTRSVDRLSGAISLGFVNCGLNFLVTKYLKIWNVAVTRRSLNVVPQVDY